jgi:hypothetical protein
MLLIWSSKISILLLFAVAATRPFSYGLGAIDLV